MKILKLRFSNLNSIYGEWTIDFENPSFQNDGIFAITGPTGSGKTTIMDAVCLALYGQTPRLGKISQGSNEIMSRQTGECFSEVLFESSKGRYLCNWSQKRSHKKTDGNLQLPRHEISDAVSGKVLESSKNMVLKRVENATGMDFERFTRSVMLAQGGFAAFLDADPAERAPILEQITGTEIYSRISVMVHEKTREEKEKLALLNAGADAVSLLSPQRVDELLAEREEKEKISQELLIVINESDRCLQWLFGIKALEDEISGLIEEKSEILKEADNFSGEEKRLEKAKKASELEGVYQSYLNIRELANKTKNDFEGSEKEIEKLNSAISELSRDMTSAEEKLNSLKDRLFGDKETATRVNALDFNIEAERKKFSEIKARHENYSEKISEASDKIKKLEFSLEKTKEDIKISEDYLKINAGDSYLLENTGVIKEKLTALCELRIKTISNEKKLLETAKKKKEYLSLLKNHTDSLEMQKSECRKTEDEIKEKSEELNLLLDGRSIDEIREEKELLEKKADALRRLSEIAKRKNELLRRRELIQKRCIAIKADRNAALQTLKDLDITINAEEKILKELEEKKILIAKIKSLEEERKKLKVKEPCPLCGSTIHPYLDNYSEAPKNADFESECESETRKYDLKLLRESLLKSREELAGLGTELFENENRIFEIDADISEADSMIKAEPVLADSAELEDTDSSCYQRAAESLLNNPDSPAEIIKKAGLLKNYIEEGQKKYNSLKEICHQLRIAFNEAKNGFENYEKEEMQVSSDNEISIKAFELEYQKLCRLLAGILDLSSFDADEILNDTSIIIKSLEERRDNYRVNASEKENLSKEAAILNNDLKNSQKYLKDLQSEFQEATDKLSESKQTILNYANERFSLYGDKNPKDEEKKLSDLILQAQKKYDEIKGEKQRLSGTLNSETYKKDKLLTEKTRYSSTLMAKESVFLDEIADAGFADEDEFLNARILQEELKHLEQKREEITARRKSTEEMLLRAQQSLKEEREKRLSEKNAEEISEDKKKADRDNRSIIAETGGIDRIIQDNENKKKEFSQKMEYISCQTEIYKKWERLHELIGSADGKKFRNFAQGLTFEIMIANANKKLESMNDRYLLIQNPEKNLDLCVIDNYQAGEIRSTKNLSGGESFIVSLALALGLSGMAGRNVRVDSLFLDEGFGTLDDDALETAIETLSGLKQDGKLIGIISHVAAIKERIPAKIEVVRRSGGRSVLKGPGCSRK